jgi:hypothetical protein
VRAIAIFAGVAIACWVSARLLFLGLPANRTSLAATVQLLAAAVLTIGGPIIGLFLAISHFRRSMPRNAKPPALPNVVSLADVRRRRATLFVAIGIPLGITLVLLFGSMVIPAAWLAGGGDMPAGHGNPNDMRVGQTILYVIIGLAGAGMVLLVSSLVVGIGLLLRRKRY